MVRSSSLINKNLISLALIFSIVTAIAISFVNDSECKGMVCRGDYPAFYSAAKLEATGKDIYDLELQKNVQNENWPSLNGRFLFFSYPPYVATILAPLSRLSALNSKLFFTFFSFLIYGVSIYILFKNGVNDLSSLIINSILFAPTIISLVSGQNLAFSFLFLTIILVSLEKKNELIAGLAIGFWIFKPHFAIIAFLGALFCRLRITSFMAASIFFLIYLSSAYKFGLYWPVDWLKTSSLFYELDLIQNGHQMVSVVSFFEMYELKFIGYFLSLFTLAIFLYFALTRGLMGYTNTLPSALILCSPHTMYYDMPLLFVPILLKSKLDFSPFILLSYVLSYLYVLLRINIILILALIFILLHYHTRKKLLKNEII